MAEMNIGKWYDPISERWIVPRQAHPVGDRQLGAEKVLESRETQRIWQLLVDSCAGG